MKLLTQNSELKPHGIYNWSIPAWYIRLDDGSIFKTCPNAGACAKVCYARNGTYMFRNVLAAHKRNLDFVRTDPEGWKQTMIKELQHKRFRPTGITRTLPDVIDQEQLDDYISWWVTEGGRAVRIHDAGDFFSRDYLQLWLDIAKEIPDVLFYAYTKEVAMFQGVEQFPNNFRYLFSSGGLQDDLIGENRHADVFPSEEAISEAGYMSQEENDLLAILLPTNRIGIISNNIPSFNKKLAGQRFSQL
jgi:hypothetical protein